MNPTNGIEMHLRWMLCVCFACTMRITFCANMGKRVCYANIRPVDAVCGRLHPLLFALDLPTLELLVVAAVPLLCVEWNTVEM